MRVLSQGPSAVVLRYGKWVYKVAPKFVLDTEEKCYSRMTSVAAYLGDTPYVPEVIRQEDTLLRLAYVEETPVTNKDALLSHISPVLKHLRLSGLRHGNLVRSSVIIHYNRPYIIDFSAARFVISPFPNVVEESDFDLLERTIMEVTGDSV